MRHLAAVALLLLLVCSSCIVPDSEPTGSDPPGTKPPRADAGDDTAPAFPAKHIFVTRGTYTGALTTIMGLPDGLAAADAICQQRAKAAGLAGTYVAWLSSSTRDAIDRITAQGPWRPVGTTDVAFENRSQLYGEPLVRLDRDERGEPLTTSIDGMAWTGTRAGGGRHAYTCNDWTAIAGNGLYGRRALTFDWTESYWTYCDRQLHLICFEN